MRMAPFFFICSMSVALRSSVCKMPDGEWLSVVKQARTRTHGDEETSTNETRGG